MPESKCNPCAVCGKDPFIWEGYNETRPDVHCYKNLETHSVQTCGPTVAEAVKRWNRLNPLPGTQTLNLKLTLPAFIRMLLWRPPA